MKSILQTLSGLSKLLLLTSLLFACESDSIEPEEGTAAAKAAMSEITAGIRSIENTLVANQSAEVLFYLKNSSDQTIEVLPWGTALEHPLSADLFAISKNGERLPYQGRKIKRPEPGEDDFISIESGESREVIVNLSQAYDMRDAGDYEVVLEAVNLPNTKEPIDVMVVDSTVLLSRQ